MRKIARRTKKPFAACSAFPSCRYTHDYPKAQIVAPCPECAGRLVVTLIDGRAALACTNLACDYVDPSDEKAPPAPEPPAPVKPALSTTPPPLVPKGACVECLALPAPFDRERREHVCLDCR